MRTIRAIAILAVFLLILTCTVQPVSAGVEPSPFKSKTIVNRINVARHQLCIVGTTLDHINDKATELNNRGSLVSATNQASILPGLAINSLRTLRASQAQYQDCESPDTGDFSPILDEFSFDNRFLQDKVQRLEKNPELPEDIKESLRQLGNILQDIQNEIDEFLSGNVD